MMINKETMHPGLKTSPWIILGATAILVVVVLVMAVQNFQREKRHMTQVLTTKGAALIRAVEAGTRTGLMGVMWGGRQVQRLLEETAQMPDVVYVAIIEPDGTVLAHSDAALVGRAFRSGGQVIHLGPELQEDHELVTLENGWKVFEVHRHFRPMIRRGPKHREHMHRMMGPKGHGPMARQEEPSLKDWFDPQKDQPLLIIAGLAVTPFEQAIQSHLRNTVLLSLLLLLLGFAGFAAMFWLHSYRAARRSWQDTSAFASEVVSHLPVGLIATDAQGRIAFFNAAAEKITTVAQNKALGKTPRHVLPGGVSELNRLLVQGQSVREREMVCDFGPTRSVPVSVSATRIVNELDRLVGHVLILRDLGEVRRLQEEIRRKEKLAALGGMAAGVAHEIRNPLSSIKGMATYLAAKPGSDREDRNAARVMVQEVDRLNRVISELLEFARPSDIKVQPVDLPELVRHSLKLIRQDAETKNIQIRLNLRTPECKVCIDPDRISQCILNLYLNAIEAMPEGGTLAVDCSGDENHQIILSVTDTGAGIADENLAEIFNPYFTTKSTGTGLGLAIVHKIVEGHRGRVTVKTTPGETTFTLYLPCNGEGGEDE